MPRRIACLLIICLAATFSLRLHAQDQNDPLTEEEVQQVRDNAARPNDRIKLYMKFIQQRLDEIKKAAAETDPKTRRVDLRDKFEEFTRLCDELQDNLDTYDSEHADIRKALKELIEATGKWRDGLDAAPQDPSYDFPQKTALEAAKSAADEAKQLADEQEIYFTAHKDQRNKNGTGPS